MKNIVKNKSFIKSSKKTSYSKYFCKRYFDKLPAILIH